MEIILKEDIIGLGYKNDIVNVKSGYGRNYLIPQGKGVIASPMAKKILAENLKQQAHKLAALKADAEKKAESLSGVALCIAAKVSATGQLYGSVGANQVAEELKKLGKEVDRKIITMKDAKTVGDFVALVHFHKEVTVEIPVKVVAEGAPVEEKKAEAPVAEAEAPVKQIIVIIQKKEASRNEKPLSLFLSFLLNDQFGPPKSALSYIEEIKAYDGIHETVNVVGSCGRPLETKAVEHLRGIVVGSFYPSCLMPSPHVISHQRT